MCIDCLKTPAGREYNGTVSRTHSGKLCQSWSSNTPHDVHSDYTDDRFPDGSRKKAKNYCRNPDEYWENGAWCYTMDENVRYEQCDIPLCNPRKSFVFTAQRSASAACCRRVSVRLYPSVRHMPVLCQNSPTEDHANRPNAAR